MRSVLLLLATLCLLGAGSPPRPEPSHGDTNGQRLSASPGLPAKVAPRRSPADNVQRAQRRHIARDPGTAVFVVTQAVAPLVEPPRLALPGAPGQPVVVVEASVPGRCSRGPPG